MADENQHMIQSILVMLVNLSNRFEKNESRSEKLEGLFENFETAMREEIGLLNGKRQRMQENWTQTEDSEAVEGTPINDKKIEKSSNAVAFELSGSEDGISGTEDIHRECIQENLPQMSHCMDLKRVLLLDELIGNGCLTENEAADIRECEKRKDQTRKLAVIMGKRSRVKFSSFLEVLKRAENYPYIAEQLENSYQAKIEEGRRKQECVPCYIIRNVNIRHIIDTLCSQFVISLEFLEEVISCPANDAEKMQSYWKRLFEQMNNSVHASKYRKVFKEALKEKYDHIAKKILVKNQIRCRCKAIDTNPVIRVENMSWPSGSLTTEEKSTTSTAARPKSRVSSRSAVSAISESVSDISNDGYAGNIPRTVEWLNNLEFESTENNFSTGIQGAQPSYSEIVKIKRVKITNSDTKAQELLDKNNSLLAIGDDLLLKTAINESMKEKYNSSPSSFDVSSKDEKHFPVIQTAGKETKSTKKKKNKRKRTQSEPSPKTNEYKVKLSPRLSQSQDSTTSERTIADRLFLNIPTTGITNDCSGNLSQETSSEQGPVHDSPIVLTPPRQTTPLVKVGCSNKGKNNTSKCKKKKKTH
ncbi:uncharacterized protein LOC134270501 [Saccostrea cucullata]|uniref:uncharacterized protein LOC134270501 n=1 Tax=Saccostrea cuccullata TaxID=36930 RepID=UPI002ED5320A